MSLRGRAESLIFGWFEVRVRLWKPPLRLRKLRGRCGSSRIVVEAPWPHDRTWNPGLDEASFESYRGWLHEWREFACAIFARHDYLIALGLATRRTKASGGEEVSRISTRR